MIQWIDETRYSKGDKERIPTTFKTVVGSIDVTVHRYIGCGNELFVTSRMLGLNQASLNTSDYDQAKIKALTEIKNIMEQRIRLYKDALNKIKGLTDEEYNNKIKGLTDEEYNNMIHAITGD